MLARIDSRRSRLGASFSPAVLLLALALLLLGGSAIAEAPKQTEAEESAKPERKRPFRGFGKQQKAFRALCDLIGQDGRREFFFEKLLPLAVADRECPACKPLFKVFGQSCKPPRVRALPKAKKSSGKKKKKKGKKQPPPPEPPRKQREPSLAVAGAVSELFGVLAEDQRSPLDIFTAVERLIAFLRDPADKTAGELEYCRILSEFIYAPFAEYGRKLAKAAAAKKKKAERWGVQPMGRDEINKKFEF